MGITEGKKRSNIAYISSFRSLRRGGQISLWNLLSRIDRTKYDPLLICPERGDLFLKALELNIPTEVIIIPSIRPWTIVSSLRAISRLRRICIDKRIKIFHVDDARQVIYLSILKAFFKFNIIWHIRVSWSNILVDNICYRLSDRIICTAGNIAKKFGNKSNFKIKVKLVYNAVDCAFFREPVPNNDYKARFGIKESDIVLGFLARLDPVKGLHFLIEALVLIKKVYPEIKLIIIGDGKDRYKNELKEMARRFNLEISVIFTGFQTDVRPFLSMLDLSILPTAEFEGSSRSILEAMASGVPVLATDIGGNAELVENGSTGIIITKPKPELIAQEAIKLLKDKERLGKMSEKALQRVFQKFDISQNIKLTEEIYESLLNGK